MFEKPQRREISVDTLSPKDVEYFCKTRVLDEIILKKKGQKFDAGLADEMERSVRMYFVVKKNRQYGIVSGELLEPWLNDHQVKELPQSAKAKACIDHYIKKLYK